MGEGVGVQPGGRGLLFPLGSTAPSGSGPGVGGVHVGGPGHLLQFQGLALPWGPHC